MTTQAPNKSGPQAQAAPGDASITYWNRLEPDPNSLANMGLSLAASIRDPLWFLTRQWQLAELRGEDAGSPAYATLDARISRIDRYRVGDGDAKPLPDGQPLEPTIEQEPIVPDLSLRVELGQTLEGLLTAAGALSASDALRDAYPITVPQDDADLEAARFAAVCAGRAIDGAAVYAALKSGQAIAVDVAAQPALTDFVAWVETVFGSLGVGDSPAWAPDRLEYRAEVLAAGPTGDTAVLDVYPASDGDLDWYAFDLCSQGEAPAGSVEKVRLSVQPTHVRFRGMPNHRYWDFERNTTDFGSAMTLKNDLGKLIVIDFMLVHGNDWFVVPFRQPVGSICWIDSLVVRDVFGGDTLVNRADAAQVDSADQIWSAFSTAVGDDPIRLAPFFIVPPSAGSAVQTGPCLEEVRFLLDETAEMAWAIEHTTQNGIGEPWSGHERVRAGQSESAPPNDDSNLPPLTYLIQTTVPENWIPLLPVSDGGSVALQRAAMLNDQQHPVDPVGRILLPTNANPYKLREEEVPRTGVRVTRQFCRTRWTDISMHLWIARRKGPSTGEGSSGLRFDLAKPK